VRAPDQGDQPAALARDPIDELRDWAQTIDRPLLCASLKGAGFKTPEPALARFVDEGKSGSYHLHKCLRQVRPDYA
jgi:hypothetical protein